MRNIRARLRSLLPSWAPNFSGNDGDVFNDRSWATDTALKQVNQRKTLEDNYLIQLYGSWSGRISLIYHAASDFGGLICQLKKLLASYFYWQVSVVWDSWFILPLLIVTTNEFSFTDIFCYQHLFISGKTNLPWSINSHVLLREHTNGWNITSL